LQPGSNKEKSKVKKKNEIEVITNFHTWNVLQGGKKLDSIIFEVKEGSFTFGQNERKVVPAGGVFRFVGMGCGLPGQSFQDHVAGKEGHPDVKCANWLKKAVLY
jgi:hypothetical protein